MIDLNHVYCDDLNSAGLRDRASAAARGDAPFDILLTGATLVDMVTGELRPADIGIVGALIASVHETADRADAAEIIDVTGCYISPGLIDTHMHVESSMVTPATYAGAVLPRGVTTVCWNPHEFGGIHGLEGVRWAVEAARNLPLRAIVLAPSRVPSTPGPSKAGADDGVTDMAEMLFWPEIGGIAEVMTTQGVNNDPRTSAIVQEGLIAGKLVCGHAGGLSGAGLNAFMAAGITSDHQLTSASDLMTKLRAGLTIELHGSQDRLLPEFVAALNALGHLPQTVTLCSDDVFPDDLLANGGLDDVVRRLVRYGLKPAWALQAATLNAARRLGRADLGLIAAGRRADIAVFEDLTEFRARAVFASGVKVAAHGAMCCAPEEADCSPLIHSVHLKSLEPADFRVAGTGSRVRLATIATPRFTRSGECEASVTGGWIDTPQDCVRVAVFSRHGHGGGQPRVGFLAGWGRWRGAFATTVFHDGHDLNVFGSNPDDMAAAADAVIKAGGGMAVASGGKVDALLPLPLSGLVSRERLETVAAGFDELRAAMEFIVERKPDHSVFEACLGAGPVCDAVLPRTGMNLADVLCDTVMTTPVLAIIEH